MCIKVKETNQWLVVKNDEFKFKPYKANPLCLVITNDNDEEYRTNPVPLRDQARR